MKMSRIQVSVLLQIIFQLMVAGQEIENVTQSYILLSTSITAPPQTTVTATLLPGYVAFREIGFLYKKFDNLLTYNEARKVCLDDNGQLAVIDSREKADRIFDNFSSNMLAWVGLGRFFDAEEWTTIDGKSTSNLPWGDGQPAEDYRCVFLSSNLRGLANGKCDYEREYLCEYAVPKD